VSLNTSCVKLGIVEFYVLLTVHLGIILVNNQLDAQFFFLVRLFQFSSCFEQHSAHHQENQLYQYNFWYMSNCTGDRVVCRSGSSFPTCILDASLFIAGHFVFKVSCVVSVSFCYRALPVAVRFFDL
jgi:hypothetical protein